MRGDVMVLWCGEDVKRFIGTTSFVGTLCTSNGGRESWRGEVPHPTHPTTIHMSEGGKMPGHIFHSKRLVPDFENMSRVETI